MKIKSTYFDTYDNKPIQKYSIYTDDMIFSFINFGAAIQNIQKGEKSYIVSLDNVEEYINSGTYSGMTIGRYGGRIANGTFTLDGETYQLEQNMDDHHMHGGSSGLSSRIFDVEIFERENEVSLVMRTELLGCEDHYPGNIRIEVTHTVTHDNMWKIIYRAVSNKDTVFNPTNHVYFNLNGCPDESILNHELKIDHIGILNTDDQLIPDGTTVMPEEKYDYTTFKSVNKGLDTPYCLKPCDDAPVITLRSGKNQLNVTTDRKKVIVYSADGMDFKTSSGVYYGPNSGIALETQMAPDAPNNRFFEDVYLKASKDFSSRTIYDFHIE